MLCDVYIDLWQTKTEHERPEYIRIPFDDGVECAPQDASYMEVYFFSPFYDDGPVTTEEP